MIRFTAAEVTVDAAGPDGQPRRSISGVAVPYGVPATVADGTQVIFQEGSMPTGGKAPKLFMFHDSTQPIGVVTDRVDTPQGMMFSAKLSKVKAADEALILAQDGVIDSVSVGVNPTKWSYNDDGQMIIEAADWIELSMVPVPAFSGAVITDIAASIHQPTEVADNNESDNSSKENPVSELVSTTVEAAGPIEVTPSLLPAQPKRKFRLPSMGEYLAAQVAGGEVFAKVNEAMMEHNREQMSAYEFALAQDKTTDVPGLLPTPIVGPTPYQDIAFYRPVVDAIGTRALPNGNGKSFIRTTISQHTSAGTQTEGSEVTNQKFVTVANTVTRTTVAAGVQITKQTSDWTDPAALDVIINDLRGQYLLTTDNTAADNLVAAATASGSTWTVTANDPTSLINSLYDAAREMIEDTNYFPTHIYASPDVWEKLGRQLDGNKNPVFPYTKTSSGLMGMNALGNADGLQYKSLNPFGLELVVDNNFAAGTFLVAHTPRGSSTSAFEIYESVQGIMTNDDASLLARNVTFYGYFATFCPKAVLIQSIAIA